MPVNTTHPDYDSNIHKWKKCRDCIDGEYAVKRAGAEYLPMLAGQENYDYESYKQRACFYDATDRTVKGCVGAIMRKPAEIEVPDQLKDPMESIGIGDESFDMVTKTLLEEVIGLGRAGVLIDSTDDSDADPYIAIYFAENITNWRTDMIDGEMVLTMVILKEVYEEIDATDRFKITQKTRYRELRLNLDGAKPLYEVELWIEKAKADGSTSTEFISLGTITPAMKGGKDLDFIPFTFITPKGTGVKVEKSPMIDLAEVNLSHYRTFADLEHGRHFTSLPTPWAAGFNTAGNIMRIGASTAWVTDDSNAKAGFLEFSGAGLKSLTEALDEKESLMQVLGARLLEETPAQGRNDTLGAVRIRHQGDHSILSNIAIACSEGLTKVLQWFGLWTGVQPTAVDKINVELNQEYAFTQLDGQTLTALMQAWQAGAISYSVFFWNLKKGQMYPDGTTEESETGAIATSGPVPPPGAISTGKGTPPGIAMGQLASGKGNNTQRTGPTSNTKGPGTASQGGSGLKQLGNATATVIPGTSQKVQN